MKRGISDDGMKRLEGQEEEIDDTAEDARAEAIAEECSKIYNDAVNAFIKHVNYELTRNRNKFSEDDKNTIKEILLDFVMESVKEDILNGISNVRE